MDWLTHFLWQDILWHNGKLLGIDWSFWKAIGWLGNAIFSSRFLVQWYVTEKKKRVVVPQAFWWLSLIGSLTFLCYSIHQQDSVFIFAYAFTWIPYIRNLVIHRRHKNAHVACPACRESCPPQSNFCPNCGGRLATATS
jgi:lipid-A-disaccharide synthase-like uncharacterized protein